MIQKGNLKYYAPFIFFLFMLLDAQITRALEVVSQDTVFWHAHLLMLALVLATLKLSRRYMVISSIVIGLVMDSYYIGIIGIYALGLPLLVLLAYQIFQYVEPNLFVLLLTVIILVTFLEVALLVIQMIFSLAAIVPAVFITRTLGPTILLNVAIFLILIIPLKKLFGFKK
ncbi:rod shape-determining protein MreD [Enterococcus timonensis]|uniref:rod shape-determining protein MreD n=1 Tax=Enterococcus timonensis TaxID=1852364 RepID=UPI0008DB11BE|nr:rod shape-determining protein MreD [Enterococcus timonensis]